MIAGIFLTGNAKYELQLDEEEAARLGHVLSQVQVHSWNEQYNTGVFLLITCAINILPTLVLLVAATLLLKSNPLGIQFHRLYAIIKLLTAAAGGILLVSLLNELPNELIMAIGIPIVVGCIYPIALIYVFRTNDRLPLARKS